MGPRTLAEFIVMDLDDTLYLERDYVASGFRAVGAWGDKNGILGLQERCQALFSVGVRGSIFDQACTSLGYVADSSLVGKLVSVYREHEPTITLSPDAQRTITLLQSAGLNLAMITGGPVESQRAKVRSLNLAEIFDPLVYARSWGEAFDKPNDRAFCEIEHLTGLTGSQIVYLGDNPAKDFEPCRRRGWDFVRIRRKGSVHEAVESPAGVAEFADLSAWWWMSFMNG